MASPVYNLASVWMDELSGDIRAVGAGEKKVAGRDLRRLCGARHGNVAAEVRHFFRFERRDNKWCPHRPGRYTVDADFPLHQIG